MKIILKFETYTLDILEFWKKSKIKNKIKVFGVFNGSFETYTRYSEVIDETQKESQRRNLVGGAIAFFISFKEGLRKKSLTNHDLILILFPKFKNIYN